MQLHASRDEAHIVSAVKSMGTTFFALLSLAAVSGCGDDGVDRAGGEVPDVVVVDPGREPGRILELTPEVGDTYEQRLEIDLDIDVKVDGTPRPTPNAPTIGYALTSEVESVSDSEIGVAVEYGEASLSGPSELDPAAEAQLLSTLNSLEGLTGDLTLSPNGALVDATFDSVDSGDPGLDAITSQINEQARSLTTPLPTEPVGVGARWEVDTEFEILGLTSSLTSTYELESLEGDEYKLGVDIDQTTSGEAPGGIEVKSDDTTGAGTIQGRLGDVVPFESSAKTEGTVISTVPGLEDSPAQVLIQEIDSTFRLISD